MNFLFENWIPFILGILFYFIIKYLIFKYSKNKNGFIFTKDISTNAITFTKDYQEILITRLANDTDYFIIYGKTYYHILSSDWTIFDIKTWLESLNDQDYAVIIELISNNTEGLFIKDPEVIITSEFMVKNHSNPVIISTLIAKRLENIYNENKNHYIIIQYTVLMTSN